MNNDILIEKIIALVDGELDATESSEILNIINQNPELQDEFNYHLKMKNVYGKIVEQPPAFLKSKILATSGLGFIFWKSKSFIISSISTAIVVATTVGYYFGINDNNVNTENKELANLNYNKVSSSIDLPNLQDIYVNEINNIQEYTNFNSYNINRLQNSNVNYNTKEESSENTNINSNNDLVSNFDTKIDSENQLVKSNIFNSTNSQNFELPKNKKYKLRKIYGNEEDFSSFYDKLNIDIRKSFANNNLDLNFQNPETNQFNISSISIYYEYSDNIDVGIEAGSESFAQKYQFVQNDLTIKYQQYFNAYYFGVSTKYYLPIEFNDRFRLYTKAFIGGNNLGPVTRGEIAVQFRLNNKWYLYTGGEISNLTYFHGGSTFNSTKSGLNVGMKYDIE